MKESDIRNCKALDEYVRLLRADTKSLLRQCEDFIKIDCPACFSSDYDLEFVKYSFEYCLCRQCGTLFTNPRPTLEQFAELHTNSKSATYWINEFFKPVMEVRREKIFKPRAQKIAALLAKAKQSKQVVGDIGAGFGLFLEELVKIVDNQIDVVAIEPSHEMAEICRDKGLSTIESFVETIKLDEAEKEKYDFLVSFEVLEHLYDPKSFMLAVHSLLKSHGYFYFTTLNGEGFDIQFLWDKSKAIFPPQHINFFNLKSIAILAECAGFEIVDLTTPGQLDWDILEGMIINENVSTERFWKQLAHGGSNKAKQELQDWISRNNLSSHMAVLVRKL